MNDIILDYFLLLVTWKMELFWSSMGPNGQHSRLLAFNFCGLQLSNSSIYLIVRIRFACKISSNVSINHVSCIRKFIVCLTEPFCQKHLLRKFLHFSKQFHAPCSLTMHKSINLVFKFLVCFHVNKLALIFPGFIWVFNIVFVKKGF